MPVRLHFRRNNNSSHQALPSASGGVRGACREVYNADFQTAGIFLIMGRTRRSAAEHATLADSAAANEITGATDAVEANDANDGAVRSGTQSIERAVHVLRNLATRGRHGWGLWDLAARCGLSRATTHRILACLVRERLAQRRPGDRHYLPGPLIFELSLSMPAYAEFQVACHAPLARLSKQFGAQAILYLRSGGDWVCASFVGREVYVGGGLEIGTRRPLISTAGGAAILIALPRAEAEAIIAHNLVQLERLGAPVVKRLEKMVRRSESLGYAFNQSDTNAGVHSFGLPLRGEGGAGEVFGALALSGHAQDFPPARAETVIAALRAEVALIEAEAARIFGGLAP